MTIALTLESSGLDTYGPRVASVTSRVYDVLRQAIVQLRFRPGHLLSEAEVAKQLGVSRQPVREAFIKLAEARLVEIRPQRGTLVLLISRREVENGRFLREAIEVAIARRAAGGATPDALADMHDAIARQREAQRGDDVAAFVRADDAFHQAIARSVDCEYAWRVLEAPKMQMDRVRYLSMPFATPVETIIKQHQAILDAIECRAPDAAEMATREHLSEILKALPKVAAANPELFAD